MSVDVWVRHGHVHVNKHVHAHFYIDKTLYETSMYCYTVSLTISILMWSDFCRNCHIFPMYRHFLLSSCFILACSVVDVFLMIFTYSSKNICLIYFVLCRFLKYLELEKSCWIVLIWMDSAKGTYILVLVLLFSSFYSSFF